VYVPLFDGAGPATDGSLQAERVARNVAALAGEDGDAWLVQQLFDYAGFALFHAGSLLARDGEAALNARVAEMLKPLRQTSDAGAPSSRQVTPSGASVARRGQLENA
jgi:hypothetical protein